jgi:hypothetical protein
MTRGGQSSIVDYGQLPTVQNATKPLRRTGAGKTPLSQSGALVQRRLEVDSPAGYLHLGFIVVSVPNLLLFGGMIVLFVIALLAPFPGNRRGRSSR